MSLRSKQNTGKKRFLTLGTQLFPGGHASSIGKRPTMEDACSLFGTILGPQTQYYGVFDGHGNSQISIVVAELIPKYITQLHQQSVKKGKPLTIPELLKEVFLKVNSEVVKKFSQGGTTAAVVIIDISTNTIYAANVGDTRIVLINKREYQQLSIDHKTSNPDEVQLVRSRGGAIIENRVDGVLMVTRALGDAQCAQVITSEPYIVEVPYETGSTLLMACDGVWDVIDNEMAVDIVGENPDPGDAAKAIKDEALLRGSGDNITVLCIKLTPK